MRVKQTARKSTGGAVKKERSDTSSDRHSSQASTLRSQSSITSDPVIGRLSNLLKTKKEKPTISKGKQMVKTAPRSRPGDLILKEIRRLQKGWELQIPRSAFHRLVREITQDMTSEENNTLRYQTAALEALQESAELFLCQLFEDSYCCTIHAKRVTLFPSDMRLCQKLQRIG